MDPQKTRFPKLICKGNIPMNIIKASAIFVLFSIGLGHVASAQVHEGKFQKLFDLYAMERYEDVAYKAEKYTRKKKYRREPEPYLYLALSLYQIHTHSEDYDQELYEDAIRDALKYAYKFRKYDKDSLYIEANTRNLDLIREAALSTAKFYFNDGEYRKASSEFKRILKVDPEDVNVMFIQGVSDVLSRNESMGMKTISSALEILKEKREQRTFKKDPVTHEVLIKAFVGYTDYLAEKGEVEEAQMVIQLGRELLPDDLKLKGQYKKIYELG